MTLGFRTRQASGTSTMVLHHKFSMDSPWCVFALPHGCILHVLLSVTRIGVEAVTLGHVPGLGEPISACSTLDGHYQPYT